MKSRNKVFFLPGIEANPKGPSIPISMGWEWSGIGSEWYQLPERATKRKPGVWSVCQHRSGQGGHVPELNHGSGHRKRRSLDSRSWRELQKPPTSTPWAGHSGDLQLAEHRSRGPWLSLILEGWEETSPCALCPAASLMEWLSENTNEPLSISLHWLGAIFHNEKE